MYTVVLILMAAGTMLLLALVAGQALGWANRVFHVEADPKFEEVLEALPGLNCGACGFPGCSEYASAVASGTQPLTLCTVGGSACAKELARIMGVELEQTWPLRPVVHCGSHMADKLKRREYRVGEKTCAAANLISGVQGCTYGCLAFGDCERACKYDAIHIIDGLATVDYDKCVGCAACARACPRNIISMVPFKAEHMLAVTCGNLDFGKDVKAVCKVGCIGCKACTRLSDLFSMRESLAEVDYDRYDPKKLKAENQLIEKCPVNCIRLVGSSAAGSVPPKDAKDLETVKADFETTVDKTEWHG